MHVSRASDWVAGMRRSIRDSAKGRGRQKPLVRLTLNDGEQFFLQTISPGPGDDFATFSVYDADDEARVVVLHLDAIRKVEILRRPPNAREKDLVFRSSGASIGFTNSS